MTPQTSLQTRLFFLALFCLGLPTAGLAAESPRFVELRVFPQSIQLDSAADFQGLVAQAVYENGVTRDVTTEIELDLGDSAKLIKWHEGALLAVGDGESNLKVKYAGREVTLPVKVSNSANTPPISFRHDIMPIFMRAGCNTGSCHGAARGKDGFMLSLFGYDPAGDHRRIMNEQLGRRINWGVPEMSLLIEKANGAVPHSGGKLFEPDSEFAQTLAKWIQAEAVLDSDEVTCTSIEISPPNAVLEGEGATQQCRVLAHYSNGKTRDVTKLAMFQSSNDNSAAITDKGMVTAGQRGEAFVMARFSTHTVGAQFIVIPKGLQFTPSDDQPANYIDELVLNKLNKLRMHPSEVCDDQTFLRRVYLDLIGMVPSEQEYQAFLADENPQKRAAVVDQLIERREFTDLWVSRWAEWLMIRSTNNVSYKSVVLYYNWLSDRVASNVPLNEIVNELLTTSGGTFSEPETNFYELERDNLKVAENVAQIFMGMRIQCAQCHNHPFDRWTQDDYYNFAAFFSQIGRKQAEDYRERIIYDRRGGEVKHPVTNKNAATVFLGGGPADCKGKDRRAVLAEWLASPENPFFAQNFSNRIWQHFFGIGIIEPVDDVRVSNPPSNPELLLALSKNFAESGYDFKGLIRQICNSKTYQRATLRNDSNRTDEINFAHQNVRRIKAETLLDVISQVTGTQDKFRGLPLGSKATQIADGKTSTYFLTTFGRATRETACSCEVKMEPSLSQALHLINGDTVNNKIRQGTTLRELMKTKPEAKVLIGSLYRQSLMREPTQQELDNLMPMFAEGSDQQKSAEDVFWALLNSREFLFNH